MAQKATTVATCGGFDPLHVGHIRLFRGARRLGDKLVVVLNQDHFLRNKKGYVFMPYEERKEILQSLEPVDEVVDCIDEDNTVAETLAQVQPDVLAKGGDRKQGNMPDNELAVCEQYGIEVVYGVGGDDKPQSSSWLVENVIKTKQEHAEQDN